MPRFIEVNPVLPVRDVPAAVRFYCDRLGFTALFQDNSDEPRYAVVRRDTVELHLQWHDPTDFRDAVDTLMLRFVIDDVDALFEEYRIQDVFHAQTALRDTAWNTREFAFYDPDSNGLTFYRDRK